VYYRIANQKVFDLLSIATEIIKERSKEVIKKLK